MSFIFPRDVIRIESCLAVVNFSGTVVTSYRFKSYFEGKVWRGSRLSYHLNKTPINRTPKRGSNEFVLHTCDHNWCIEPFHLYLGTQKQNIDDMMNRNIAHVTYLHRPKSEIEKQTISKALSGVKKSTQAVRNMTIARRRRMK